MMSDQFISCVPNTIRVEPMRVIRNLIEVKISDKQLSSANFIDGIDIQVRSEKPFTVNAYWVVKIRDIHLEIEKDWKTMRDELWEKRFLLGNKSLLQNEPQIHLVGQEPVQCNIKPPRSIDIASMTVTPRDFYPLVIIVTCHEEEPNPLGSAAAANIHIVHIKDDIVPMKSQVIKQYIKQIDGRILDISQLYPEESAACIICFEEASQEEGLKLFCLLPCRHSSICSNCIGRIRECPKCRSPIASVFDINAPSADQMQQANSRPAGSSIDPSLSYLYDDHEASNGQSRRSTGFFGSIKSMFGL